MPETEALPITVLIGVKNDAENLRRCLAALQPVERVLVVDSHSTDDTAAVAADHGAERVDFDYHGGHPKKRQWAMDTQAIASDWTLLLDADEIVPPALWDEIRAAVSQPADRAKAAYFIRKGYHFMGRRFRFGGFSFQALLLVRTGSARFEQLTQNAPADGPDMEVHERLLVDGPIGVLRTPLIHDDMKGLHHYLAKHNAYAGWEARLRHQWERTGRWGLDSIRPRLFGNAQERRRWLKLWVIRLPIEPWIWFGYHFWFKLGFLEGRRGYWAAAIRSQYVSWIRAKTYELRLAHSATSAPDAAGEEAA